MLTEKTRLTEVTAEAVVDDYAYNVTYKLNEGALSEMACNIFRSGAHVGHISNRGGSTNTSFKDGADAVQHLTIFSKILAEVKEVTEKEGE